MSFDPAAHWLPCRNSPQKLVVLLVVVVQLFTLPRPVETRAWFDVCVGAVPGHPLRLNPLLPFGLHLKQLVIKVCQGYTWKDGTAVTWESSSSLLQHRSQISHYAFDLGAVSRCECPSGR